jgi:hypothetical protein
MKATPEEYAFHQRISAHGDPIAFAELAEQVYHPLVSAVRWRAGAGADPALIEEAVGNALLDYHDHPFRYDPHLKSLQGYLTMAAYRDFQNAQAKENRVRGHLISLADPSLRESDLAGDDDPASNTFEADEIWDAIAEVFPNADERQIVELIINREHSIEPYAVILRIDHLPEDERRKEVQRVKYRIARRLRRNLGPRLHPNGGELL